jgi:CHASE3 domain sensor protein
MMMLPDRQSVIFQSLMLCESSMNSFLFLYILLLLLGFGLLSFTAIDSVQQQSIYVNNETDKWTFKWKILTKLVVETANMHC